VYLHRFVVLVIADQHDVIRYIGFLQVFHRNVLVSVNVEKLAKDGYIKRTNIEGDRRKIRLSLTEKAQPIVGRGKQLQQSFFDMLFENTTDEMKKNFTETVGIIDRNLDEMLKG